MIRVLLVDDHAMVRQGLRRLIEDYPEMQVVGEASNGEEAIKRVGELAPSVVVMDIKMPKLNGIEATRLIKRTYPQVVVVGLSVDSSEHSKKSMKEAGAESLLAKETVVEELYAEIMRSARRRSSSVH